MQETQETWVWSLGREDPLEEEWPPASVFLPGKSHGQRSLAGHSPQGHKELDVTQYASAFFTHNFSSSLVAQRLKCLPAMWETWVRSLGREDPLEKEMATHSSILAWGIPWTEEPGRLQSMGSQRVGHDWATSLHFHHESNAISTGSSVLSSVPLSVQSLSCVQLCDSKDCSTPGFPVHHQLPELPQTHVHRVGETGPWRNYMTCPLWDSGWLLIPVGPKQEHEWSCPSSLYSIKAIHTHKRLSVQHAESLGHLSRLHPHAAALPTAPLHQPISTYTSSAICSHVDTLGDRQPPVGPRKDSREFGKKFWSRLPGAWSQRESMGSMWVRLSDPQTSCPVGRNAVEENQGLACCSKGLTGGRTRPAPQLYNVWGSIWLQISHSPHPSALPFCQSLTSSGLWLSSVQKWSAEPSHCFSCFRE